MSNPSSRVGVGCDELTLLVKVTLDDLVALHMELMQTPIMRADRRRRAIVIIMTAPLYALACGLGGVVIRWISDSSRKPFGHMLFGLLRDLWPLAVLVCIVAGVLAASWVALARRLAKPRLRRILRRVMKAFPDVDPADPELAYTARVSIDDDGLQTRSAMGAIQLNWDILKRWYEADDRLFILGDAMTGMCLNIAAIDHEKMGLILSLVSSRLGPRSR